MMAYTMWRDKAYVIVATCRYAQVYAAGHTFLMKSLLRIYGMYTVAGMHSATMITVYTMWRHKAYETVARHSRAYLSHEVLAVFREVARVEGLPSLNQPEGALPAIRNIRTFTHEHGQGLLSQNLFS